MTVQRRLYAFYGDDILGEVVTSARGITSKIRNVTVCGAEGILFRRADGTFGVEEISAIITVAAKTKTEAQKTYRKEFA